MATNAAAQPRIATRPRSQIKVGRILLYVAVVLIVLFCVAPLLWVFDESLKTDQSIVSAPPTIFPSGGLSFISYGRAFSDHPTFASNIKNSVIIAGSSTIISLIFGSSAGYAIARLRFKGRATALATVLAITLFPAIAIVGPLYVTFYQWHWIDTYQALIIPNVVFTLPLTIWILTTFFRDLPRELEESAKMDGAGIVRTFFSIVLPLAAPGVFTAANSCLHRRLERVLVRRVVHDE